MLRLIGIVLSVGLADSLNPSTVGPALFLAMSGKRVLRVCQFTLGILAVSFPAGIVLTIGPGRFLIGLVPHPQRSVRHIIELVVGILLIIIAAGVWSGRRRLARRPLPMSGESGGGSAFVAGLSIAAFELPTAAPYFATIAAIVASPANLPEEILLVGLYNLAFVAPLVAIIVVLLVAGESADRWLQAGGSWLQRRWPIVLAGLLVFVGGALTIIGGTGLVRR
jgi:cytochrome c biogenesis protein CcdA